MGYLLYYRNYVFLIICLLHNCVSTHYECNGVGSPTHFACPTTTNTMAWAFLNIVTGETRYERERERESAHSRRNL